MAHFALADADYLNRLGVALRAGNPDVLAALTNVCPECDGVNRDRSAHAMVGDWVVIGCEGYWTIDPALVGLDRGNWSDWRDHA